jgi:hypothetical protein
MVLFFKSYTNEDQFGFATILSEGNSTKSCDKMSLKYFKETLSSDQYKLLESGFKNTNSDKTLLGF